MLAVYCGAQNPTGCFSHRRGIYVALIVKPETAGLGIRAAARLTWPLGPPR